MPRTPTRRKHVACLESLWDEDIRTPLTVRHLLQASSNISDFQFAHLTCNTKAEFVHNLRLIRGRRSFGILYLAFHGAPGQIELGAGSIELEELADLMHQGFRGWVLHLGTCSTMAVENDRLDAFVTKTGVAMVFGYSKDVSWLESASTELLLLDWLQQYVDMGALWKAFRKEYLSLVELTGLSAFPVEIGR